MAIKKPGKPLRKTVKKDIVLRQDYEVGNKKPPKHTQFKPGQSGNPLGPMVNPEKRALKELTTRSLKEAIETTMTCNEEELEALLNDKHTSVGHKIIIQAALNAMKNGAYSAFDQILERAIGKVANKVDLTSGGRPIGQRLEDKEKVKAILKDIEEEF